MMECSLVVAFDRNFGIGKDGVMPWHLPEDMQYFKELTTKTCDSKKKNAVIMGRKTWDSIPEKFRPFSDRYNIVLTRQSDLSLPENVIKSFNLEDAFEVCLKAQNDGKLESVFVIGGGVIFDLVMDYPCCTKLFVTHIDESFECDTFFPKKINNFSLSKKNDLRVSRKGLVYYFAEYHRLA